MTSAAYEPNSLSVFISDGLPPFIKEEQIRQHAAKLGIQESDIIDVAVHKDVTGNCVGYAYITCSSPDAAQKTASILNKTSIAAGCKLKVLYSTDRKYCQCVPVNWPESHTQIVLKHLRSMTSKERESFISSVPAKISLIRDEIMFVGNQKDVIKSLEVLKIKFLSNVQQQTFSYQCAGNSEYETLIEKFILIPQGKKLDFYYSMNNKDAGATLDISIFGQTPADFFTICNDMQKICPSSCQGTVVKEAVHSVKDIDVEMKYRVKVVTTVEGSIIIHALTKHEADLCLKEIEDTINSTHVVTKVIPISHSQAQYLEANHKLQSEAAKQKVKFSLLTQQSNDCSVTLKGTINSVNAVMVKLKCYIETEYNETIFDVEIDSKYIKMWFKRWQQLKAQQETQQDVIIQFVLKQTIQNDPETTCVTFQLWGNPKCIDPLKTLILTRESGNCIRGKLTKLPKYCAPTITNGLKNNEISIHSLPVEVEIDEVSDIMTIIAPQEVSDEDIKRAKEIVLFYMDNQKQLITLSDPVMGLILASPKYSSQLQEITRLHNVKVDAPKFPKNDLMLTGNQPALENVVTALQKLQISMIADIDQTTLLVDPYHVDIIESDEFLSICKTIEDQLFVTCSRGYRKMNIAIESPVLIQPTPLSHCIKFEVVRGSLINENVYAIVNNANENLQHKDGVAKLIVDAGGPSIQSDSNSYITTHGKLKSGEVVCLGGGSLLCRRVIHVVWPHWGLGGKRKEKEINSIFSKVLNIANGEKIESLSFSIFGSNISPEVFAKALLNAINHFCKLNTGSRSYIQKVRCVLPDNSTVIDAFMSALCNCAQHLPNPPEFSLSNKIPIKENKTVSKNMQKSSNENPKDSSSKPAVSKTETIFPDSWEWQSDNDTPVSYDAELCKVLSIEYAKNPSGNYYFTLGGYEYCIDFATMTQTNTTTKKRRCVHRHIPASSTISPSASVQQVASEESRGTTYDIPEDGVIHILLLRGLKVNLENSKVNILELLESVSPSKNIPHSLGSSFFLTFPPEWQPQSKTTELFPLSPETPEWDHVAQLFQQSMPKSACTIMSVERIQNKWLWERYFQHRKRLHVKNNGIVNEKELFHGTRTNEPRLIYEGEDGFDMRYSAQGKWGRANYFAANATYSDGYAHINAKTGLKEMFLVKLLTGESYKCDPDSSLRVPPPIPGSIGRSLQIEQLKYDTVTGSTGGSQVYMAYDNEKAYPAYLIEYKV